MLTWLTWGLRSIALLNVVAMVALYIAYGWHHRLKPMREHRRARTRAFERLLHQAGRDK